MLPYLKISRPVNLLIMAATLVLARLYVVQPVYDLHRQVGRLEWAQFALLVLATLLIALGGYWINDCKDVEADRINRPDTNPVGKQLNSRKVMLWGIAFTILGVLLGNGLSAWLGATRLGLLFTLPAILLWFYNSTLKHWPVVGNIAVSIVVGLVPALPGLHEMAMLNKADAVQGAIYGYIALGSIGYGLLAFSINWVRELVKDIEDIPGDDQVGSRTLPILIGDKQAKFIAILLMLGLIRLVLYGQQMYLAERDYNFPLFLALAVQLPLAVALVMTIFANSNRAYKRISLLLKLIAAAGVASMLFYNVLL